ncbi:MAG: diacylglycerol kinase family protein [Syntrophomonas sp.]|uniref:diacylglycerol kinase family protein n=1 Tax=Syntrophomonas sp. TaxID=2053627 RepID=UPI002634A25F|nr:diacylglycerol kinase family protein [Syntrophomonas sp.]MDD3879784.1 diacylglycerol kinase family protein [Syntrophomonas sp.]MDD4625956.1 diacylglycerol kinase family protein [Syntrophomonas sp.]
MKGTGLKRSFACALAGIAYAFQQERNMKIHGAAAVMAMGLGLFWRLSRWEWGLLLITIFVVLAAETINTAIEKVVDLQTESYHPLAEAAKDLAAGAVLLTAIMAVIMAILIFGPYLLALAGGG